MPSTDRPAARRRRHAAAEELCRLIEKLEPRIELIRDHRSTPRCGIRPTGPAIPTSARTQPSSSGRSTRCSTRPTRSTASPTSTRPRSKRTADANPGLRWVHTMAAGGGGQVKAAGLAREALERIAFTTCAGVHGGPLAEFAVFGVLAGAKDLPRLPRSGAPQWTGRWEMRQVDEMTVLVVGLGGIGAEVRRGAVQALGAPGRHEPQRRARRPRRPVVPIGEIAEASRRRGRDRGDPARHGRHRAAHRRTVLAAVQARHHPGQRRPRHRGRRGRAARGAARRAGRLRGAGRLRQSEPLPATSRRCGRAERAGQPAHRGAQRRGGPSGSPSCSRPTPRRLLDGASCATWWTRLTSTDSAPDAVERSESEAPQTARADPAPAVTRPCASSRCSKRPRAGRCRWATSPAARAAKSSTSNLCRRSRREMVRGCRGYLLGRRTVELGGAYITQFNQIREFYGFCDGVAGAAHRGRADRHARRHGRGVPRAARGPGRDAAGTPARLAAARGAQRPGNALLQRARRRGDRALVRRPGAVPAADRAQRPRHARPAGEDPRAARERGYARRRRRVGPRRLRRRRCCSSRGRASDPPLAIGAALPRSGGRRASASQRWSRRSSRPPRARRNPLSRAGAAAGVA